MVERKHVAIIGGGITGLSAAFRLQKMMEETKETFNVTIIESSDRFGGKIETIRREGFTIERGPDSFLKRKKEALELVEELGLSDQLVSNNMGKAYILKNRKLHSIPESSFMGVPSLLKPLLDSTLLSEDGKARALNDLFIPPYPPFDDMSVGDFFAGRLGQEMVDDIINPLLSGIYAGDLYKLSLRATLPQFIGLENRAGSLILGAKQALPKKKTSQFATLKKGLSSLVDRLVETIRFPMLKNTCVTKIEKMNGRYKMSFKNGEALVVDGVIFTIPHEKTQELMSDCPYLKQLSAEPCTSVGTVAMAFDASQVTIQKEGTGFVASNKEPSTITAATYTHLKWPHTTPSGKVLLRCYVGKAGDEEILDETDETIILKSLNNLKDVVDIDGQPEFSVVTRLRESMPQYVVGHTQLLKKIEETLRHDYPRVYLAGASYDGVGLPDCIRQGNDAAKQLFNQLKLH
ncbi:protoporphyrinogen oxidase [Terrilactibacillus laevilacticus]|uniref:Coproporphyrinogen III oxidase n=1 Tax=Terrilactibacillus laevilacticus TaxID=1380157 RepID=A0ABW5PQM4_9BACI|nr:protoporphyrinogen oxidase [Terrilactibacillus laevilacticus]